MCALADDKSVQVAWLCDESRWDSDDEWTMFIEHSHTLRVLEFHNGNFTWRFFGTKNDSQSKFHSQDETKFAKEGEGGKSSKARNERQKHSENSAN